MALIDELDIKPAPDFERLRKALLREGEPDRVPFYELFFDKPIKDHLLGKPCSLPIVLPVPGIEEQLENEIEIWYRLGFDYVELMPLLMLGSSSFKPSEDIAPLDGGIRFWLNSHKGAGLASRENFDKHHWHDPDNVDLGLFEWIVERLPEGMALVGQLEGVVESATWIMGYENIATAMVEDPELIKMVFDKVGSICLRMAERLLELPRVGAIAQGDDMGHKTATLLSPRMMREYAFGWHKKIVETCHEKDVPYILHSCGQVSAVMDDLIEDVGIDAKHSYEDIVTPVEEAKSRWGDRIAVLGGIDIDILSRGSVEDVKRRTREVLRKCAPGGGYALGSGNSVANYLKPENYLAMIKEGWENGTYPINI